MHGGHGTEDWILVMSATRRDVVTEASLVLVARDIEHHVTRDRGTYRLIVPPPQAERAAEELRRYREENRPQSARPSGPPILASGFAGVAAYVVAIWLLPSLEQTAAFGWDWRAAGTLHAGAVLEGDWWRTVTALTLHGDLGHLLGNTLSGIVFGWYIGRYLGSGFGWLLIVAAGAIGNYFNAMLQPEAFRAIGASTASFGALGLGATYFWRGGYFANRDWRRSVAPLFAGLALLAFTGVGDENTDVVGHFLGFAAGAGLGIGAAWLDPRRLGRSGQHLSAYLLLVILVLSWYLAGSQHALLSGAEWQP